MDDKDPVLENAARQMEEMKKANEPIVIEGGPLRIRKMKYPLLTAIAAWLIFTPSGNPIGWFMAHGGLPAAICFSIANFAAGLALACMVGEWASERSRDAKMFDSITKSLKRVARGSHSKPCSACGGPIGEFKNEASHRMFHLNGACQGCQDKM